MSTTGPATTAPTAGEQGRIPAEHTHRLPEEGSWLEGIGLLGGTARGRRQRCTRRGAATSATASPEAAARNGQARVLTRVADQELGGDRPEHTSSRGSWGTGGRVRDHPGRLPVTL